MHPASPPPRMPRCSALSRSFLPGQDLRSGGTWQLSGSTDRQDQPNRSVHAFRGTPKTARRSGICMLVPLALVGVIALANAESLVGLAVICAVVAVIAASGFLGYGVVDAWQERRS